MTTKPGDEHVERFTALRPLLFTIAYEILGSATESDDVLQESYLRWAEVDLSRITDTKAYLAQLVTRQSLNALRAQSRRREDYIGPWLPEPLLTEQDASADVVLAESVSMAMLVVLETLSPTSVRCSCCGRCSGSPTTRSPRRSASPPPRCARWRTGHANMCSHDASGSSPSTQGVHRDHHALLHRGGPPVTSTG